MEHYLQLTPQQFDQDKTWWWRIISDQWLVDYVMSDKQDNSKILEVIEVMKYYVDHYKFRGEDLYKKQLIRFHIGQLYGDIWYYNHALEYFIWLQNEWYKNVWVEYLEFTIKFLQWDLNQCSRILDWLSNDWSIINTETMQRIMKFWWSSYIEAYSGMKRDELKQWIIENKK
jgi:hypothetical protein